MVAPSESALFFPCGRKVFDIRPNNRPSCSAFAGNLVQQRMTSMCQAHHRYNRNLSDAISSLRSPCEICRMQRIGRCGCMPPSMDEAPRRKSGQFLDAAVRPEGRPQDGLCARRSISTFRRRRSGSSNGIAQPKSRRRLNDPRRYERRFRDDAPIARRQSRRMAQLSGIGDPSLVGDQLGGACVLGIAVMPGREAQDGTRLWPWENELSASLAERILAFDEAAASAYASVISRARASGRPISMAGGQIAAIAMTHGLTVATRDAAPFEAAGLPVINPWNDGD